VDHVMLMAPLRGLSPPTPVPTWEEDEDDEESGDEMFVEASAKAPAPSRASGRWTRAEHEEFLKCLDIYGREWKKVSQRITTRTAAQIRSHAQKYFKKISAPATTTTTTGGSSHAAATAPQNARQQQQQQQGAAAPSFPGKRLFPVRDEAVAVVDDVITALRNKRDRCADRAGSKRPRLSLDGLDDDDDWRHHDDDDAEDSDDNRTPPVERPWRRRSSEPNLARLDLDPKERPVSLARRRVVSCEDLGDSELIALEMLCTNTSRTKQHQRGPRPPPPPP